MGGHQAGDCSPRYTAFCWGVSLGHDSPVRETHVNLPNYRFFWKMELWASADSLFGPWRSWNRLLHISCISLHEPHSAHLLHVVCLLAAVSDQSGFCSSPVVDNGCYLHGNWSVWQFKHHNWATWGASLCCWFCNSCSKMSVTLYLFLIDLFLY